MDWKLELDLLVENTIAFVNSVNRESRPDLALAVRTAEQRLADTSKPIAEAITPATWRASERDEILQCVNNFKAHQKKMERQREDYYLQMKAKMLASADPSATKNARSK